jgi:hypothetical protein
VNLSDLALHSLVGGSKPKQGEQTFVSSGTFIVPSGVKSIDVFIVGGGGGTRTATSSYGSGGGGGGYQRQLSGIPVSPGQQCSVVVGAGGSAGSTPGNGGYSQVTIEGVQYRADGGGSSNPSSEDPELAGNGHSGGGRGAGSGTGSNGGSDGSHGGGRLVSSIGLFGQGSLCSARIWGHGELYSGGGGGGSGGTTNDGGLGGAGGGGDGGGRSTAQDGVASSGGGAGGQRRSGGGGRNGGSGVVIIRWGY